MAVQSRGNSPKDKQSFSVRLPNDELNSILAQVEEETENSNLRECIHFTTGVLHRIERQMTLGCFLVADTRLILNDLDPALIKALPVQPKCFLDNPQVVQHAATKRLTRAEVAMEIAMSLPGPKIMIIGSAPMALRQLIAMHHQTPLIETTVIAAVTGFANVVELKEQTWDSGIPGIVVRGRNGGPNTAIAITNALLRHAVDKVER